MASEQYYGLSLVLGGGEVSMQELAGLYQVIRVMLGR
jgi:penicillin-binding protein 1C